MINLTLTLPQPVLARLIAAADEERVTVERLAELCLTAAVAMYTIGQRPPIQRWRVNEVAVNLAIEDQEREAREKREAARAARLSAEKVMGKVRRAPAASPPQAITSAPSYGPTPLLDVRAGQCRFDVGGLCCGRKTAHIRTSYCAEHDAVVHGRKAVAV